MPFMFIFPTVPCRPFATNNYTDCSSSLQSTSVLMISFGLFTSPEREGGRKGKGYSPHFTFEDVETQSSPTSCVTCPAYEAECQRLILQMECGSLTLNTVCFPCKHRSKPVPWPHPASWLTCPKASYLEILESLLRLIKI